MKSYRHYTRAPITEALIDLKVESPPAEGLFPLREVQRGIESDYPLVEDLILAQQQFQTGPGFTTTSTQTIVGYRFLSSDKKRILQAHIGGFTFSQLEPYDTWEVLRNEAKRLWNVYRSVIQPKTVQRIAVRYINRLDLPVDSSGFLDFKDYLRTVPEVSPALPQGLSDYFMQLQIPQEDLQASLILNEAILPTAKQNTVSVLLDIDLFSTVEFESDSDAAWRLLEKFRDRKNEVFEACITDKTRELLK